MTCDTDEENGMQAAIEALVLAVVAISGLFFLLVDSLVYKFVQLVLGI